MRAGVRRIGLTGESDPTQQEAHGWFAKAAKQGYAPAMSAFAGKLDSGSGTPVDFKAALEWMTKAAEAGDRQAFGQLALWYIHGHIVAPDKAKQDEYAAKMRDSSPRGAEFAKLTEQMREMSARNRRLQNNIDPDRLALDKREANAGNAEAARRVADEASRSDGKQDCAEAAHWYERAGDLGDTYSYLRLGEQYYTGQCQKQDFARARVFLLKASDANAVRASYAPSSFDKLANMEMFGHGQAVDYPAAYLHLKMLEMFSARWTQYDPARLNFVRRQLTPEVIAENDQRAAVQAAPLVERCKQERAKADAQRRERDALIRGLSTEDQAAPSR